MAARGLSLVVVSWAMLCCGAWAFSLQWLLLWHSLDSRCEGSVVVVPSIC